MAKRSFSAQLSDWARNTEQRMAAVFRQGAQTVANEVRKSKASGGHMPVDTGNLRRSLIASNTEMPTVEAGNADFADKSQNIKLTIAKTKLGGRIYLGFQAVYARRMEYGFRGEDSAGRTYNQVGNGFVRLTAQRWPQIITEAAKTLQGRVEARQSRET
jgi:hypothetical protein